MRARLKVSRAGVELIKSFEGLRQTATRLPDGRWTLGYGHTFSAREGARVTQEDADALLRFDLLPIVDAINNLVLTPLNQNQFDALVSFCFNIGTENFTASTVLKRINEGKLNEAAQAMDAWRSAEFNGQTYVLAPLIRRRAAEKSLFLTPEDIDHASVMTMRPVEDTSAAPVIPDSVAPASVAPEPVMARQVIDLSAYAPAAETRRTPLPPAAPTENLPGGLTPNTIREDVPELAEVSPSQEVQAALQRAQDEQARREETQRQDALRQAQALAEARAAEQARQLREADERARMVRQQQEAARVAEAARLEAARLEAARLEQARLEQARLDEARREREAAEAARLEAAKAEQARLEEARLEAEKAEAARIEQTRIEQARQDAEQRALEAKRAEPDVSPSADAATTVPDDAAERARKAEAAAALMRLYSPYGGGALGRPLTVPRPEAPPVSEGFVQHSVISPASAQTTPIEIAARPEDLTPEVTSEKPEQTPETQPESQPLQTFAPVNTASFMQAPVGIALNPYARPQAEPQIVPQAQEVPRPAAVDMSAQAGLNWREQLDRPLPQTQQASEPASIFAQSEQRHLSEQARLPQSGFGAVDESYGDDAGWTLDGGRIAMSSDTDEPEQANWWTKIVSTFWWIFISGLGMGCLGVAAGAYYKSRDAVVIRNGAVPDYMTWSVVMAAVGILCVSVSLWLIMKRLGGLKD